jgi:ABC-type glycerol-3-phosphate transport system substrate-binding protein
MSKKVVFMIAFCLIISGSFAWAAGQGEENASSVQTLKFWRMGTDDVWVNYVRDFIGRYEENNPGIKVEYEYFVPKDLPQKLNTSLAAGIGPDVVGCSIQHVAEYAAKGVFMPIDEYLDSWSGKSDIPDSVLDVSLLNGKHYALAYHPDPYIFAYRKDFFREAGLDPNSPPDTWEELLKVAPKLTKRDGDIVTRAGFLMPIDDFLTFVPFAVMNGASYISKDEKPTFNGPEWVEALEVLTTLVKDQKVTMETTNNQEWTQSTFSKGNAAIAQVNTIVLQQFFNAYPDKKDEVGYFAISRKRASNWNGAWLYAINSKSEMKDEGWSLIEKWMEPNEVWSCYQATGNIPVLKSLSTKFTAENPVLNSALFAGIENGLGNPLVPWATLQIKYMRKALSESFYGLSDPKTALEENYQLLLNEIK